MIIPYQATRGVEDLEWLLGWRRIEQSRWPVSGRLSARSIAVWRGYALPGLRCVVTMAAIPLARLAG